jgi:hypothetical protein
MVIVIEDVEKLCVFKQNSVFPAVGTDVIFVSGKAAEK